MSLALYAILAESGLEPDLITCNAAARPIITYPAHLVLRGGGAHVSLSRSLPRHAFTYISEVLSALARGSWQLALAFFWELKEERQTLDVVSLGAALSAFDRVCLWEQGLALLAELPAMRLRANAVICNTAMSACAKAGRWQVAAWLMDSGRDVISFNCAIAASGRAEEWRPALSLFCKLQTCREATLTSYNSAIVSCAGSGGGSWRWALTLLGSVPSALGPDTVSFDAALRACEAAGRWREALQLLSDFRAAGLLPEAPLSEVCKGHDNTGHDPAFLSPQEDHRSTCLKAPFFG